MYICLLTTNILSDAILLTGNETELELFTAACIHVMV